MKRVRFVAPARRELLSEVAYCNSKELGLGARFLVAIEDAHAPALVYPLTGTPASENTRRVFLRDFPFSLVYRPHDDGIVVFALAHHARCPEYWRSLIDASGPLRLGDGNRSSTQAMILRFKALLTLGHWASRPFPYLLRSRMHGSRVAPYHLYSPLAQASTSS
ncbi:type II toxin-antitoxin system RelE/ParE family toxin [Cyanobium sp. Aljojuca 7A6]|nr:type II toxin-antitoxin system RelE/ParE family toxin [Cyanobium sp. La Preciosa 7G6]MCP9937918.1 type II toxin-antitoxin system RelE/ParE family toxin [Cyanobium sp. Aljojuca 7A6]